MGLTVQEVVGITSQSINFKILVIGSLVKRASVHCFQRWSLVLVYIVFE